MTVTFRAKIEHLTYVDGTPARPRVRIPQGFTAAHFDMADAMRRWPMLSQSMMYGAVLQAVRALPGLNVCHTPRGSHWILYTDTLPSYATVEPVGRTGHLVDVTLNLTAPSPLA